MIIEIFINILLFSFFCFGNGCLVFFVWWIIGQPSPVDRNTAQFVEGRVFSQFGRKMCDWYERYAAQEEIRLMKILESKTFESQDEKNLEYYHISRTKRRSNPAKAFGVCPVCMGTYIILLLNIMALILIGFIYGFILSLCISIPFMVYGWALSLTVLKFGFLS